MMMRLLLLAKVCLLAASAAMATPSTPDDSFTLTGSNYGPDANAWKFNNTSSFLGGYQIIEMTVTDRLSFGLQLDSINTFYSDGSPVRNFGTAIALVMGPSATGPGTGPTQIDALSYIFSSPEVVLGGFPNAWGGLELDSGTLAEGRYQLLLAPDLFALFDFDFVLEFSLFGGYFGWGPTLEEEFAQLGFASGGFTRLIAADSFARSRRGGANSLQTRQKAAIYNQLARFEEEPTVSYARERNGLVGNIYTWVEFTGMRAEGTGTSFSGNGIQLGTDLGFGPNAIVGVSLGYEDLNASQAGFDQTGNFTYIQPYAAYEHGDWSFSGGVLLGRGEFTQVSLGGTGDGSSRVAALNIEASRAFQIGSDSILHPTFAYLTGIEEVTGVSGTLAGAGTQETRFHQATIGATFEQQLAGAFVMETGLFVDHVSRDGGSALSSALTQDEGLSARVEFAANGELANGTAYTIRMGLGGMGSDLVQQNLSATVGFSF